MIVDLHLKGELVIVAGAGSEALKKIDSLRTQDCKIIVFGEAAGPQIKRHVKEKKIKFVKTKLEDGEFLSGYRPRVVMAATNDKELNRKILKKARSIGAIAYASDDPGQSDFAHPSVINMYDVIQIAVSTGGRSPIMARKIKTEAEKIFKKTVKKEDVMQIILQESMREEAKKKIKSQKERKRYLYSIAGDEKIKQLIKDGKTELARRRAALLLENWK